MALLFVRWQAVGRGRHCLVTFNQSWVTNICNWAFLGLEMGSGDTSIVTAVVLNASLRTGEVLLVLCVLLVVGKRMDIACIGRTEYESC